MITKNSKNLPEYIVNAVNKNYKPKPNRISVTSLVDPPLIRTLLIKHWDELEDDAKDKLWMLHGTALDDYLKKHSRWGLTNIKIELPFDDVIVVAKPDYYNVLDGTLADIKDTSVWNLKEVKKAYECQLNVYDWMMNKVAPHLRISSLQIHGFARDWRKNEKIRYHHYPNIPFEILLVNRWDTQEQLDYIDAQLKDHKLNPDRECTPEEKWQKSNTYAVMKKGRKSALRVLDSEQEAKDWMAAKKQGDNIVKRPGSCIRCGDKKNEGYCPVSSVCKYRSK